VDVVVLETLHPGTAVRVTVDGTSLVLANSDGELFAVHGECTHAGGPLGDGRLVRGNEVECPLHGACFDVRTGDVRKGPAKKPLRTYETRVRGEMVQVRVLVPER
jgi:3-phenylpropionate/trans-cinnamate dioxygenase ferredoxin subunit